jgi:carboxylesterase type B
MIGHNANEAGYFTPNISTDGEFRSDVQRIIHNTSSRDRDYISNTLYPNTIDGTHGYKSQYEREALLRADAFITCNTRFLALASRNQSYSYRFEYPPAYHGLDVPFTFFNGITETGYGVPVDPRLAGMMQTYFVNFVMSGNPNSRNLPLFPRYSAKARLITLSSTGIGTLTDPNANERCAFWQSRGH